MNESPLVSIIMSVYNEDLVCLQEAIESVLNQTYKDFEFIIYDDASKDDVRILLEKFSREDGRIILVRNDANMGLTNNLIMGIKRAKGEYICRQDSDDISLPERLEEELRFMRNRTDVSMLCTAYFDKFADNTMRKHPIGFRSPEGIKARLFIENSHVMHGSVMIRSSFLRENDLNYDPYFKKAQDFDLWTKIADIGKIYILPKYLCIYRHSDRQISTNAVTAKEQKNFHKEIVLRQIMKYYPAISENERNIHLCLALGLTTAGYFEVFKWMLKIMCDIRIRSDYKMRFLFLALLRRYCVFVYKKSKKILQG